MPVLRTTLVATVSAAILWNGIAAAVPAAAAPVTGFGMHVAAPEQNLITQARERAHSASKRGHALVEAADKAGAYPDKLALARTAAEKIDSNASAADSATDTKTAAEEARDAADVAALLANAYVDAASEYGASDAERAADHAADRAADAARTAADAPDDVDLANAAAKAEDAAIEAFNKAFGAPEVKKIKKIRK
ncbi:hypothetical protein [Nocardia brasiliensis]|uniref:hypothetical protein n=1 Tax=Nocardia brasiliensis TaxID=37326 RepID=UPI0036704B0E